jgi:hypothetical protein
MPNQKQSIGVQAARFSLYAPFVALVLGFLTLGTRNDHIVALTIGITNCLLIGVGFIFGILALISIRKYGASGILGRAITGTVLNGIFLALILFFLVLALLVRRTNDRLVGHWKYRSGPDIAMKQGEVDFESDGTCRLSGTAAAGYVSLAGRWSLNANRLLTVVVDRVDQGDPLAVGKSVGLGTVKEIGAQHFLLATDNGDESYDRLP